MTDQEPEQIGSLIFVQNPNYPYPFKVERPPYFWMHEQTGALAEAIEVYMSGEPLSPSQLAVIQTYLRQYLERAVLTGDAHRGRLVQRVSELRTTSAIEEFAEEIAEFGIEPF